MYFFFLSYISSEAPAFTSHRGPGEEGSPRTTSLNGRLQTITTGSNLFEKKKNNFFNIEKEPSVLYKIIPTRQSVVVVIDILLPIENISNEYTSSLSVIVRVQII